jgi:hypothetical protein
MPIVNAFTCTGAYALLIMSGLKRVENRSCLPVPARGRCAMSVSKKFCRAEYDGVRSWLMRFNSDRVDEILTPWDIAQEWSGRIIAVMDYEAIDGELEDDTWRVQFQYWNEGYRYWWRLSNIRKLPTPILCRGNTGMWQLPPELSSEVEKQIAIGTL